MAFTYDLSTDAGKVRLLISDTNQGNPVFQDDEINAFLALNDGVKRSAAAALDVIASNEAMVLKVISILGLTTNGAAVATALRDHAKQLRDEAQLADAETEGGLFDYAEVVTNQFTLRERVINQRLREDD